MTKERFRKVDKNEIESKIKESQSAVFEVRLLGKVFVFFLVCDFIPVGRELSVIFGFRWRSERLLVISS